MGGGSEAGGEGKGDQFFHVILSNHGGGCVALCPRPGGEVKRKIYRSTIEFLDSNLQKRDQSASMGKS
jgi:hypothetical protein